MIASLVATLKQEEDSSFEKTLNQLRERKEIEIGQIYGVRLPLTIEAESTEELELLTQWVQGLNGILHVDIIFASFEPSVVGV